MNNNKEFFVVVASLGGSSHTYTKSFTNDKEAQDYQKMVNSQLKNLTSGYYTHRFSKQKHSVGDIFLRLIETNPVEEPKALWKRAKEVFKILEEGLDEE